MKEKLGKAPQILDLYHGTRKTNPNDLIKSEEGFDVRFSKTGLWGKAIYFAEYSNYSHDYAFSKARTLQNMAEVKQMFQAKVIVGEFIESIEDNTLIMPPMKNAKQRYDSVKGVTQTHPVYMVYANQKAYPEYLITYQLTN